MYLSLQQTGCSFDRYTVGADITGIISIREGSEYHLQTALASAGPISIAVDASTNSFRVSLFFMLVWRLFVIMCTVLMSKSSHCASLFLVMLTMAVLLLSIFQKYL